MRVSCENALLLAPMPHALQCSHEVYPIPCVCTWGALEAVNGLFIQLILIATFSNSF